MKHLLVVNGHPDPRPERFCSALCSAYLEGAEAAGWSTSRIDIGELPLSAIENLSGRGDAGAEVSELCEQLGRTDRLAVIYPLWFDKPPEALRAVFAWRAAGAICDRRAQLVVTMDMPAFAYRSMLRPAAAEPPLALSIPGLVPDEPVLVGSVGSIAARQRRDWLDTMRSCGTGRAGLAVAPVGPIASIIDRTMSHLGL